MDVMRNTDGFVLKNTDGLILKGNHDFGACLKAGIGMYAELPQDFYTFSVLGFSRNAGGYAPKIYLQSRSKVNQYGMQFTSEPTGNINGAFRKMPTGQTLGATNYQAGASGQQATNKFGYMGRMVYGDPRCYIGQQNAISNGAATVLADLPVAGVYIDPSYGAEYPEVILFNRGVSHEEYIHYWNLNAGNDLLKANDLVGHWKFDQAEILNCYSWASGAYNMQKVGCRDFSGNNNHMYFTNLPAGTLDEQLTYANTNVFKPW